MANILITQTCIRSCPYCFAKKHMGESDMEGMLKWEDFIYLVDFFQSSGERNMSLLGGEPTLHPHFVDFIIYGIERGMHVNIFTSGVMSDEKLAEIERHLAPVNPDSLSFVVNLNDPAKSAPDELKRVDRFLAAMGHLCTPGFNIYRLDFDLTFLFHYVARYGMGRHMRLGVAHPIYGRKNNYIKPDQMKEVMTRLISYEPLFTKFKVKAGLDCGFPMCAFDDQQLGVLHKITGGHMQFGCGPAIDIGPDMSVWCCFPLSGYHKRSIYDFDNMGELVNFYIDKQMNVRSESGGLYPECDTCQHREEKLCDGGCVAHALCSFEKEEPLRIEEIYESGMQHQRAPLKIGALNPVS